MHYVMINLPNQNYNIHIMITYVNIIMIINKVVLAISTELHYLSP